MQKIISNKVTEYIIGQYHLSVSNETHAWTVYSDFAADVTLKGNDVAGKISMGLMGQSEILPEKIAADLVQATSAKATFQAIIEAR